MPAPGHPGVTNHLVLTISMTTADNIPIPELATFQQVQIAPLPVVCSESSEMHVHNFVTYCSTLINPIFLGVDARIITNTPTTINKYVTDLEVIGSSRNSFPSRQ
jgi:hypothetical protein